MLKVETAITVRAPVTTVRDLYADYAGWPALFPTIKGVRLVDQRGSTAVLDIDHVEGHVINELTVSGNEIRLWEVKRHYDALFVNQFHAVPEGTRFVVHGEIHLKGAARLLRPVLRHFVRQQMERWHLQPVKAAAEARFATQVRTAELEAGPIDYADVGAGPTVVFLHGVLMAGDVRLCPAD